MLFCGQVASGRVLVKIETYASLCKAIRETYGEFAKAVLNNVFIIALCELRLILDNCFILRRVLLIDKIIFFVLINGGYTIGRLKWCSLHALRLLLAKAFSYLISFDCGSLRKNGN